MITKSYVTLQSMRNLLIGIFCVTVISATYQNRDDMKNSVRVGNSASSANIDYPDCIIGDKADFIYIASNGHILRLDIETGKIARFYDSTSLDLTTLYKPATATMFRRVKRLAICASNRLVVADLANLIYQIDLRTGEPKVIAGNGKTGYSGDDGLATLASFRRASGLVCDASGNLFIADDMDHRIRRVDGQTGIITTFAGTGEKGFCGDGGSATNACFQFPMGIAVNSKGNLFIADYENHRIRRIDSTTHVVTTVAGNGDANSEGDNQSAVQASLHFPKSIAIDKWDNLYIVEGGKHVIRRVDPQTGLITRFAGTGESGLSGDGGLATNAQLSDPGSITVDGNGNVFIADWSNRRIRRIGAQTGIITTVAGGQ